MSNDEKNGVEDLVKSENGGGVGIIYDRLFPLIEKQSGKKTDFILLLWVYNPFG